MSRERIFEKYTKEEWIETRVRFLRIGDIVRWRDINGDMWNLVVITEDPEWDEKQQIFVVESITYKLTEDFKFDDDMTHVVVNPKKE